MVCGSRKILVKPSCPLMPNWTLCHLIRCRVISWAPLSIWMVVHTCLTKMVLVFLLSETVDCGSLIYGLISLLLLVTNPYLRQLTWRGMIYTCHLVPFVRKNTVLTCPFLVRLRIFVALGNLGSISRLSSPLLPRVVERKLSPEAPRPSKHLSIRIMK